MTGVGEVDGLIEDRLDEHNLRYTAARRAIVTTLLQADGPVTLPELLDLEPDLAQSSAYRSLAVLCEAGVVRRLVHVGDHALFELDEHLTEHHHHLVCERCGTVVDVILPDAVERAMDRCFEQVAADAGFRPTHHAVDIYGECARCRPDRTSRRSPSGSP